MLTPNVCIKIKIKRTLTIQHSVLALFIETWIGLTHRCKLILKVTNIQTKYKTSKSSLLTTIFSCHNFWSHYQLYIHNWSLKAHIQHKRSGNSLFSILFSKIKMKSSMSSCPTCPNEDESVVWAQSITADRSRKGHVRDHINSTAHPWPCLSLCPTNHSREVVKIPRTTYKCCRVRSCA